MLAKLIKYDLKFIFKTVGIFAILLLLSAILHNITSYDYTPTFMDASGQVYGGDPDAPAIILFLHTVFYNAIYCFLVGLLINTCTRIWQRFKSSMYGDESYLTHTIPLSRRALWTAKFLSALLTILSVLIVLALTCFILNLTDTGKTFLEGLGISSAWPLNNLAYAGTLFTQLTFIVLSGISGIILAHRLPTHKPHSFLCGFGLYILGSCVVLSAILLLSQVNPDLQTLFANDYDPYSAHIISFVTRILSIVALVYAVIIAIYYGINTKLLARGVDVD